MREELRISWVKLLLVLVALLLIPAALLFFRQHSMIYYPRAYAATYQRMLPPGTQELEYNTPAGKQVAFYLPARSGAAMPARVWVAFSGNASVALDWLDVVARNPNESDAYLLLDYPGYGKSEGRASIASSRASADQAISTLAERLNVSEAEISARLCVMGVSLGAAAALEFAAGHPVQRAVLIAPFTTLREVAAQLFTRPASYLLLESYDNRSRIRALAQRSPAPRIAIFHGTDDTLIPLRMGQELAQAAGDAAQFFPVQSANHDTVVDYALDEIIAWMNQ
ncbi:MAG: alpha/beta hydrolase [Chthoniobacterales bacterium]|nr:alpha/beta hydrolase [Chthoniobacterales bacterium]